MNSNIQVFVKLQERLVERLSCFDASDGKFGDVLFVLAGTIHAVKNIGSGNRAELATYVVEKRTPLITLVK